MKYIPKFKLDIIDIKIITQRLKTANQETKIGLFFSVHRVI